MKFHEWWDETIFVFSDGKPLSRNNLILSMRDQDGGSHFDEHLTPRPYLGFREYRSEEFVQTLRQMKPSEETPADVREHLSGLTEISGARDATMRQIAWEVQYSFAQLYQKGRQKIPP